jgi:hypothetical protein
MSVDAAPCGWHLKLTFVALIGFYTCKLVYALDSLVRVSRRVSRSHFDKISIKESLRHCDVLFIGNNVSQAYNTSIPHFVF